MTKVTNFGPRVPDPILRAVSTGYVSFSSNSASTAIASNTLAIAGVVISGAAASNFHLLASDATHAAWVLDDLGGGGSVSFGSNAMAVNDINVGGASTNSAREDHRHQGIATITASSSNTMQRPTVNLRAGSNIVFALTDTDGNGALDTLTIQGSAAGGGSSDAITGQSGLGGATIPGFQSHPDIPPTSPGSGDDEFNTTDTSDPMTGWTTLGTPTTHNINSTFKSQYYVEKAAAAGVNLVGIYKAKSPAFTVTCKLTGSIHVQDFMTAGLFIGEAAPGKMEIICLRNQGVTYFGQVLTLTATSPTGTLGIITAASGHYGHGPLYLRIVVVSSTDVTYYWSTNGYLFTRYGAANRNPGFTIGAVGLCVEPENATDGQKAAYDWIRFT